MLQDTYSASKITGYLNMLLSLFNTGQKLSSTGNCLTLPIVCKLLFVWNKTYFVEKKLVSFSPEILKGVKITGKLVSGNTGCLVSRFQIWRIGLWQNLSVRQQATLFLTNQPRFDAVPLPLPLVILWGPLLDHGRMSIASFKSSFNILVPWIAGTYFCSFSFQVLYFLGN